MRMNDLDKTMVKVKKLLDNNNCVYYEYSYSAYTLRMYRIDFKHMWGQIVNTCLNRIKVYKEDNGYEYVRLFFFEG